MNQYDMEVCGVVFEARDGTMRKCTAGKHHQCGHIWEKGGNGRGSSIAEKGALDDLFLPVETPRQAAMRLAQEILDRAMVEFERQRMERSR